MPFDFRRRLLYYWNAYIEDECRAAPTLGLLDLGDAGDRTWWLGCLDTGGSQRWRQVSLGFFGIPSHALLAGSLLVNNTSNTSP